MYFSKSYFSLCTHQKKKKVKVVKAVLQSFRSRLKFFRSTVASDLLVSVILSLIATCWASWGFEDVAFLRVLEDCLWDFLWSSWSLFANFDACSFLVVPEGVNRIFSGNNQDSYSSLKWTLNGLLTETLRGLYDCPVCSTRNHWVPTCTGNDNYFEILPSWQQLRDSLWFYRCKIWKTVHLRIDEKWWTFY